MSRTGTGESAVRMLRGMVIWGARCAIVEGLDFSGVAREREREGARDGERLREGDGLRVVREVDLVMRAGECVDRTVVRPLRVRRPDSGVEGIEGIGNWR